MPQFLSPVCNDQMFDVNGDPLNGGQVETYIAGSSTPAATYTSSAGTFQQANPILLNSLGKTSSPIWLAAGVAYKFVVKDSSGVTLWTIDNVRGINDASVSVSEWVDSGFAPTYISSTSFSVPGDQTSTLHIGRRIRTTNTAGTVYSGISNSVFGSGVTTITAINDSGSFDAGLSAIAYGLLSAESPSAGIIPRRGIIMWSGAIADIPLGWYLCNGSNGTPDLRDRFVIGAGTSYAVAATGGSKDAIVVAHTHTGTTAGGGTHAHTLSGDYIKNQGGGTGLSSGSGLQTGSNTDIAGFHDHSFTTNSTGSSGTNANLPPYYALAFIMRG